MPVNNKREKAKELVDQLSDEDLEIVLPIARRLAELKATEDIEKDEKLMHQIREGLEHVQKGEVKNWREVNRE